MATHDPNSRLTEGSLNSPYASPNGITGTGRSDTPGQDGGASAGGQPGETAGEKIGRFFRRAMDRISGHDEDAWRGGNERNQRERDTQDRYRKGDPSWQYGRSALRDRDRDRNPWSDLGRSDEDRNRSYRSGPSYDTGGGYERLSGGRGSGGLGQGQETTGRSYGQAGAQPDVGTAGVGGQGFASGGGRSSLGQQSLGRSPGESYALGEVPQNRGIGSDRGFRGDQGRDDWGREQDRTQERWGDRDRGQSGASGMSAAYAGAGAGFGFGRDEQRAGDWGELGRDRDQGQGRRFWQREPLAARDVMTRNPRTVNRQSSIRDAAMLMRDENCGVVPVVDGAGRLEGILTDRDIVVRGLVDEVGQRRIEDVMTDDVSAVTEDEPLTSVLDLMGRKQVRRVPVVDRNDRLLGIISMADIANRADYDEDLQDAFERISSRRSFWSLFS